MEHVDYEKLELRVLTMPPKPREYSLLEQAQREINEASSLAERQLAKSKWFNVLYTTGRTLK